jgi:hypothetical protein
MSGLQAKAGSSKTCNKMIVPWASFAKSQAYWTAIWEFADKSLAAKIVPNFNEPVSFSASTPASSSRYACSGIVNQLATLLPRKQQELGKLSSSSIGLDRT